MADCPDPLSEKLVIERRTTIVEDVANFVQTAIIAPVIDAAAEIPKALRRQSIVEVYEKARIRGKKLERSMLAQKVFEYAVYLIILLVIYFVFVGFPLWNGTVYWLWYVSIY